MLTRRKAKILTQRLDKIANHVQKSYTEMGLSKKAAYDFCLYLDQTADMLERSANTLLRDEDEVYMDTFNSPAGPIETEPDEPYMQHFDDDDDSQLAGDPDLTPMNSGGLEVEASNWYERSHPKLNWYE